MPSALSLLTASAHVKIRVRTNKLRGTQKLVSVCVREGMCTCVHVCASVYMCVRVHVRACVCDACV